MTRLLPLFLSSALIFPIGFAIRAEEPKTPAKEKEIPAKSVEQLAKELRSSLVVVTVKGRNARGNALGTGFVVDSKGIIATNLHVIGEGQPISVETADGKKYDVTTVHATDRGRDLALIKIDAKDLPALTLSDSDKIKEGQPIVVLGNPLGLKFSVVSGVISGRREIDGNSLIQIAVPVEQGNSGGPVLDMQGHVLGVVSMKSLVTANLGFAMPINALKSLIAKPNPVAMDNWATIGALDAEEWKSIMGATWRQRAGRITVEGAGSGFGGRSCCINQMKVPDLPYEISVAVKLDDERGAAGLIFHDDGERHYGFYPTGGKLRLTRFEGPDVFTWRILEDKGSEHYKPGEWNTIKVRVAKDGVKCFVNDHLAIESDDAVWSDGKVGLAKFRETKAGFKNFQVAKTIPTRKFDPNAAKTILKKLDGLKLDKPAGSDVVSGLSKEKNSTDILRQKAKELEAQATSLRELAGRVHQQTVYEELGKILGPDDGKIELIHAALLLAKLDNEEVDVDAYRQEVDRLGKRLLTILPKDADDAAKIQALNRFFFDQRGFHGSRQNYYHRSNSYLNEVLDDREGIPISLCVLYSELAQKIGLKIVGIGAPGHFIVRHVPAKGKGVFIDVFEGGKTSTEAEMKKKIEDNGYTFREDYLQPVTKKQIITRMLYNLVRVAQEESDTQAGLRYLDGIVMLDSDSLDARFSRSVLRYSKGMKRESLEDINHLLEHTPEDFPNRSKLIEMKRLLERELAGKDN
jgi:S1-C subfamily serine protease/regulator of sirC expression with transglutaminase-like and TPR domain